MNYNECIHYLEEEVGFGSVPGLERRFNTSQPRHRKGIPTYPRTRYRGLHRNHVDRGLMRIPSHS